ncbi:HHL211Cp [Eremothecium sinecaudum]|uniref:General transcriptional corepressor TUP1 n=1 Tax=Eremothecium sinecaudum TaxID=45286 RepID=A0A0X8HW07_9SACH|nr:HHL211Cp [Eremothecium sinecaudum]AMD22559.1 HHL211Cp [Eremothecium sinecaudum]
MSSSVTASQAKVSELLEAIRQEFNNVSQEATSFRLQNQKDYDYKINRQLAEMQQIRNTVYELELTHRKMKDAYEEEISRLKVEVEQRDRQLAQYAQGSNVPIPQATGAAPGVSVSPAPALTVIGGGAAATSSTLPSIGEGIGRSTVLPKATNISSPQNPQAVPVRMPPHAGSGTSGAPLGAQQHLRQPLATVVPPGGQAAVPVDPQGQPEQQAATGLVQRQEVSPEHYLVPYDHRFIHAKPIPPFLVDLDADLVPAHLKKQTPDYYVLYNPALPRDMDVDLHNSLDHSSVVCCVRFSNDGEYLATGCNKTTQVYRVSTGELVARLSDDTVNSDSTDAASGPASGEPAEANADNSAKIQTGSSSDLYIRSVCFSPGGKYLATGAEDKLIRIWDLSTKKILMTLQGHEQDIYSLDYFPSGDKLVSGSGDRTVRIWDLRTGQCSLTLSIEDGVTTVAVSPGDGKYIAAGSLDRTVRVWDSETGFLVERLDSENELSTGHKDSVYSVVFTRDGRGVVSGSLDRSVKLWDLGGLNGQKSHATCEVTYTGHKDFVLSVATTQNDEYILSGSKDRGVLFWDTNTGNPLLMLQGHRNSVISVAAVNSFPLGPDVGVFATGSGDCKARIWKYTKKSASSGKVQEVKE